jgi:hypothetical protein
MTGFLVLGTIRIHYYVTLNVFAGKVSTSGAAESGIGGALSVAERKGSSDSLTSQKSIESQRSSDSQSSAPVRDTLHKAKRQIQALIGKLIFHCEIVVIIAD